MSTATLQSSYQKNVRIDCKASRLSGMWLALFQSFRGNATQKVVHEYSPSSNFTSTGSTVQETFDAASDSFKSLSKFKSFVSITLISSLCATTGPLFAFLCTILGLLLTSLHYSPQVPTLRGFEPIRSKFLQFKTAKTLRRNGFRRKPFMLKSVYLVDSI